MIRSFLIFLATTLEAKTKFCELWSDELFKPCYTKDILVSSAHSPHQLAVHKDTNTLYFCFDFGDGEPVAASFNLDTRKTKIIQGLKDVYAIATSPWFEEVLFGGSHGLYRYDTTNEVLKLPADNHLDIWWLVLKDKIYFIQFPDLHAYYYANNTVSEVGVLKNTRIQQFVFDGHGDVFFSNGSGFYGVKGKQIRLVQSHTGLLGLATDNSGKVYVSSDDGIFIFVKLHDQLKMIANILGVAAITFDKDNNLIYSDKSCIVRLVPVKFQDNMGPT